MPKSHAYDTTEPSASDEPVPSTCTVNGAAPLVGSAEIIGVGDATSAPGTHSVAGSSTVPIRRLSTRTAESNTASPWSNNERYSECSPGVSGVAARSSGVAPSKVVPSALAAFTDVTPAALTLISLPRGSNAMLRGAEMVEPAVVHVLSSNSMMNASLNEEPTHSGNSSVRNRKSTPSKQFVSAGAVKSSRSTDTSKSVSPRVGSSAVSSVPKLPESFGRPISTACPVLSTA